MVIGILHYIVVLKGNTILAEQILKGIKTKLVKVSKREFHLECNLEKNKYFFK